MPPLVFERATQICCEGFGRGWTERVVTAHSLLDKVRISG